MKAFTDIEQSKTLATILPLESADMCYRIVAYNQNDTHQYQPYCFRGTLSDDIPCWSLAALLEQLDDEITDNDGNDYSLYIIKDSGQYQLYYHDDWGQAEDIETHYYDDMIDACHEMILKLHELNLL